VVADRWGRRRSLALCFLCYAASFSLFAGLQPGRWALLVAAASLYGLAEALRSGSHKAIILDYLDQRGEGHRATEVIGLARSFSKTSSASSALVGGLVLWAFRAYDLLFWLSAIPAVAGFFLMLSYPHQLDGEQRRERQGGNAGSQPGLWQSGRILWRRPGLLRLLIESVLFESQVKIILKYYLQPFLKQGLAAIGIPVLGAGAIWIGVTEFARDQLGAFAALSSARVEARLQGGERGLRLAYAIVVACAVGIGVASLADALLVGIALVIVVTALQNLRRPIFVSSFNRVMDKPQRATALSLESLCRTVLVSILLPVTGAFADQFGLWSVFIMIFAVLVLGRVALALLVPRQSAVP
jgi:hypothetical protein